MPELPEIEALVDHLRRHAVGLTVGRVDVAALSVLKTFDPPINVLHGQTVVGAQRWGKYLGLQAGQAVFIADLSRAGWLRWSDNLAAAPLRPGKRSIAPRCPWAPRAARRASTSPRPAPEAAGGAGWFDDPKKVPGIEPPSARMRWTLALSDLAGLLAGSTAG